MSQALFDEMVNCDDPNKREALGAQFMASAAFEESQLRKDTQALDLETKRIELAKLAGEQSEFCELKRIELEQVAHDQFVKNARERIIIKKEQLDFELEELRHEAQMIKARKELYDLRIKLNDDAH